MTNTINKKLAVFAIAAVAAFSAGAAGAATGSASSGPRVGGGTPQFNVPQPSQISSVTLFAINRTEGCVRVYANGRHNLSRNADPLPLKVAFRTKYTAALYKGAACSGKPFKSASFTTSNVPSATWNIR